MTTTGVASLFILLAAPAAAEDIVGVVSDVSGGVRWSAPKKGKPDLLDDLRPGDSITVAQGAALTLLYYATCRQELVTGPNQVKVGKEASTVSAKGRLKAEEVACDPPKALLAQGASALPQALVLMGGPKDPRKRAEREFQEGIEAAPKDVVLRLKYAAFLENDSRWADAEAQYREALKLRPKSRGIARRLAEAKARRAAPGDGSPEP